MRPWGAASSKRAAVAAVPVLLAACIPGVLTVGASDGGLSTSDASPPGPDGAGGDSSNANGDAGADQVSTDGSPGVDAPVDSSDAAALPDGFIQCPATSVQCQAAGIGECCDAIFGSIASDGGFVYTLTMASCEAVGGPNCGSLAQVGPSFTENFPQTCSTLADCTTGSLCCVAIQMGGISLGAGHRLYVHASPDRIICRTADCPMPLMARDLMILSHLCTRGTASEGRHCSHWSR